VDADVIIVGLGTAGAAAAALCAERGLAVIGLEQRPLADAGARWLNGVPRWMFVEAGIAPPAGDELCATGHAFHLLAGWGPRRLVLREHELCEVDMRRLVERLQHRARSAGARLVERSRVLGLDGPRLMTAAGPLSARWFVDASGLAGARLVPTPPVEREDLCAAAQEVREVADPSRARAFFERHGVRPGDTLCFTAIAGGFSIVNLRLDAGAVSVLTGSIPADGQPSGSRLIAELAARETWIGPRIFGGARAVPLRRPYDRLGKGRVLLLGDAACQVFSAHGSGIGAGLIAARVLADTLAGGGDAQAYSVAWHRRWGGLMAGYDLFRRFSQKQSAGDFERLMDAGLLDEHGARAALVQRFPELDLARALSTARGLARHPALVATLARVGAAQALYARYPRDGRRLPRWSRAAARLLGGRPDVT
jgi:menaquinone-9 beta-reductase